MKWTKVAKFKRSLIFTPRFEEKKSVPWVKYFIYFACVNFYDFTYHL